ncbi:MAG TPA: DUF3795 domain-containing protein [Bacteroidota bacterium]|nr:DUF3795 domain-containing protein [Bacteroidota bacterium]
MAPFSPHLVAACGMDCTVCKAHLREKKPCPGCRAQDAGKPPTRVRCRIKRCSKLRGSGDSFCHECDEFPCENLERLDARYRTKYRMSMIGNLCRIKGLGMEDFLRFEAERWKCAGCGGIVCVHDGRCAACGAKSKIK